MATQEEIRASGDALQQEGRSLFNCTWSDVYARRMARAALEAAERVREGLSKSRARRLGHFVMTGDDVLIREDRPE